MKINTQSALVSFFFLCSCLLLCGHAYADAPLESKIDGLTMAQKKQIKEIQKEARDAIRPVRGELNREKRKLRRAEADYDAATIEQQKNLIEPLEEKFRAIFQDEEAKIRNLLTPDQETQYEQWLAQRNAMVGSSRDAKVLKE